MRIDARGAVPCYVAADLIPRFILLTAARPRDLLLEHLNTDRCALDLLLAAGSEHLADSLWILHLHKTEAAWATAHRLTRPVARLTHSGMRDEHANHGTEGREVLLQDARSLETQFVDPPHDEEAVWVLARKHHQAGGKCLCGPGCLLLSTVGTLNLPSRRGNRRLDVRLLWLLRVMRLMLRCRLLVDHAVEAQACDRAWCLCGHCRLESTEAGWGCKRGRWGFGCKVSVAPYSYRRLRDCPHMHDLQLRVEHCLLL
mmetsp:Transcript_72003/g.187002  ORF Transcript_72003/g.187002 Transcript_72003/m.187002 type:complete len:257 (+) Transcript_72003:472-1242(+)